LTLSLATGCGYQFQGSGSILPDDIKTVAIPVPLNDTTQPGLGIQFAETLRTRFDRYGVVEVVDDVAAADAILRTRISSIEFRTKDVTSETDIALEQELVMTISADLRRRSGQILWADPAMRIAETFSSTSDTVVTSSSKFAQGGIGSASLGSLSSREVARGQQAEAISEILDEASRKIYLDAVAADF
ncbi:MAG: hypothetical protein KDA51_10635, partial [Planctomycetales bacterium]|nr:hypothetical protein [Planctomycetales bacterium]